MVKWKISPKGWCFYEKSKAYIGGLADDRKHAGIYAYRQLYVPVLG